MERNSSSSAASATKACATPVPAGKAATSPASTATRSSPRSSVPRPRSTTKISSSAMWACRGEDCLPGDHLAPEADCGRAGRPTEVLLAAPEAALLPRLFRHLAHIHNAFSLVHRGDLSSVLGKHRLIGAYNKDLLAIMTLRRKL